MPGFNGTGPMGQGARTGRGMGRCGGQGMGRRLRMGMGPSSVQEVAELKQQVQQLTQTVRVLTQQLNEPQQPGLGAGSDSSPVKGRAEQ